MGLVLASALAANMAVVEQVQANTVAIGFTADRRDYRHPLYALPGQRPSWLRRFVHNRFVAGKGEVPPLGHADPTWHEIGAGVLLPDGRVLTAAHVVLGIPRRYGGNYTLRLQDGRVFPATLAGVSPTVDAAVLQFANDGPLPRPLAFAAVTEAGPALFTGFPVGGKDWETRRGRIEGLTFYPTLHGRSALSLHWAVRGYAAPGNSGGPVVNDRGQVIGIVSGGPGGATYAVPASAAVAEIDHAREQGRAGLRCIWNKETTL